jgi:hypothetical protein
MDILEILPLQIQEILTKLGKKLRGRGDEKKDVSKGSEGDPSGGSGEGSQPDERDKGKSERNRDKET